MANTFKSISKTGSATAADTWMTLYTAPAATTSLVLQLGVSNISTATVSINVEIVKSVGDDVFIVKSMALPAGTSFEFGQGQKYVLATGDALRLKSDKANSIDLLTSVLEIT